jgi:hypothetical protein
MIIRETMIGYNPEVLHDCWLVPVEHIMSTDFPGLPTEITLLTSQVLDELNQYCDYIYGRGSWMIRPIMGTPKGYWDISKMYSDLHLHKPELIGKEEHSQKAVKHLTLGPREIDLRYEKKEGITDEAIVQQLQRLCELQKVWLDKCGLTTRVETINMNEINGKADQRIFWRLLLKKNHADVFALDIGQFPDFDLDRVDGRFRSNGSLLDLIAPEIIKQKDGWVAHYRDEDVDYSYPGFSMTDFSPLLPQTILREINQQLFWGNMSTQSLLSTRPHTSCDHRKKKMMDTTTALVGATRNPIAWLILAEKYGVIQTATRRQQKINLQSTGGHWIECFKDSIPENELRRLIGSPVKDISLSLPSQVIRYSGLELLFWGLQKMGINCANIDEFSHYLRI